MSDQVYNWQKLDLGTKRRLIYAKYLLQRSSTHLTAPTELDRMLVCHHLDFALELVLKSMATVFDLELDTRIKLKDLWNEVNQQYRDTTNMNLPSKRELFALHDARNAVQHHGNVPSKEDLMHFLLQTESWMTNIYSRIFSISFEEVSLAALIHHPTVRDLVKEVEDLFSKRKYSEAIDIGQGVFHYLVQRELGRMINEEVQITDLADSGLLNREIASLLNRLNKRINLGILEIDCRKFQQMSELDRRTKDPNVSENDLKADAIFCLSFILEVVLRWQDSGYQFDLEQKNFTLAREDFPYDFWTARYPAERSATFIFSGNFKESRLAVLNAIFQRAKKGEIFDLVMGSDRQKVRPQYLNWKGGSARVARGEVRYILKLETVSSKKHSRTR